MQYNTFELDKESQDLCTIITPFGKYKYATLPIGLKCSPNVAQAIMESTLAGIKDADIYIYIDDVGAFYNDWNHHVQLLADILCYLHENGFTINPLQCEWVIMEMNWHGYWLTPGDLKPWKTKIKAILHMDCPTMPLNCVCHWMPQLLPWHVAKSCPNTKTFDGSVQFEEKAPIPWTDEMQQAVDKMCALMVANTLASFPDHNKWFDIYTKASHFQLGVCIVQDGQPDVYFSCKLSKSQQNYAVMEKDMLSIVPTLVECQSISLVGIFMFLPTIKTWPLTH